MLSISAVICLGLLAKHPSDAVVLPDSWLADWPSIVRRSPFAYYLASAPSELRHQIVFLDMNGDTLGRITAPAPIISFALSPDNHFGSILCATEQSLSRTVHVINQLGTEASAVLQIPNAKLTWTVDNRLVVYRGLRIPGEGIAPKMIQDVKAGISVKLCGVNNTLDSLSLASGIGKHAYLGWYSNFDIRNLAASPFVGEAKWLNNDLSKSEQMFPGARIGGVTASYDSRYVAATLWESRRPVLSLMQVSDGRILLKQTIKASPVNYCTTCWSPERDILAATVLSSKSPSNAILVFNPKDLLVRTFKIPNGEAREIFWKNDADILVVVNRNKTDKQDLLQLSTETGNWTHLASLPSNVALRFLSRPRASISGG